MSEWLDVIPWILGATAVSLGFLLFQGPPPVMPVEAEVPVPVTSGGAQVIDLAEFRQRRAQAEGAGGRR